VRAVSRVLYELSDGVSYVRLTYLGMRSRYPYMLSIGFHNVPGLGRTTAGGRKLAAKVLREVHKAHG